MWNAVNVGITALLHEEGRRVVLVFTDGVDAPFNPGPNSSSLKDVMKRAEEENVMVYAIGLAGVNGGGMAAGPEQAGVAAGTAAAGVAAMAVAVGAASVAMAVAGVAARGFGGGASDKPDPGLAKIAAETGAGYFELTNTADLASTFKRVAEELHHQYLLGFAPTLLDGKTHRIDVHIKNTEMTIRARKTYLAAAER